ncbi:MAG: hypothetical protein P1U58_18750 [Verrucomicrobiales bacterium]|nr:hypothetical protein [Verrucomicrobiales bacterium]
MARRRGFLAELQHQAKQAQLEQARAQREAEREYLAAVKHSEQLRKEDARLKAQLERAQEAERKQLEKEAKAAHLEAKLAEVDELNLKLAEDYDQIDSLLEATLHVDDYVDLNELKKAANHPPFMSKYAAPIPPPLEIPDPPEPHFNPPAPPKGIRALLGKEKHEGAVTLARYKHGSAVEKWKQKIVENAAIFEGRVQAHAVQEGERLAALDAARVNYENECAAREADVALHNEEVDQLINNLEYGVVDSIHEYVTIVLSNSVYPSCFRVGYDFVFAPETAELELRVLVPGPSKLPTTKAYKYTKSSDEISSTELSQKACKDRYASAVHQVAIRSLHEIFEADRRGLIKTISLEVGTETINPATGKEDYVLFVATGAEREAFLSFDLSCVVPSATLEHLGASVSKNPYALVPTEATGVRRS